MSNLSSAQVSQYAQAAGFTGNGLDTIVAIAKCESGFNPSKTNTLNNFPPSQDRGLVQINNYWHKEVSDACAFDPTCAMQQAYKISSGGTNFIAWQTYRNGCYRQYLGLATSGNTSTSSISTNDPTGISSFITSLSKDIAVFVLALLLIILGVMLLAGKQIGDFTKSSVEKSAEAAAL
jgi:hypothetical protein